jgi:predicted TIM-barrel fold metal-dependent hydrolase
MTHYTGPVVDTHRHIWMRKVVAWRKEPPTRRAIGDCVGPRRDISVQEWMHDLVPQNEKPTLGLGSQDLGGSVHVDEHRDLIH